MTPPAQRKWATPLLAERCALHVPLAIWALVEVILGHKFGGYHTRTWGWVALGACVAAIALLLWQGAWRARTPMGIASGALLGLAIWSGFSVGWAIYSQHDAWQEANRTLMYAAVFVLGGIVAGDTRKLVVATGWIAAAIGVLGIWITATLTHAGATTPLSSNFLGGRLDLPIGYSNGEAALFAMGALLAIGCAIGVTQRAAASRTPTNPDPHTARLLATGMLTEREWAAPPAPWLAAGAGFVGNGLASLLVSIAWLCQSRGSIPALIVALIVAFIVVPWRWGLLVRVLTVAVATIAVVRPLDNVFTAVSNLENAQQNGGSAAHIASLSTIADTTIAHGAKMAILAAIICAVAGAITTGVALGLAHLKRDGRPMHNLNLGAASLCIAALVACLVVFAPQLHSSASWAHANVNACLHPKDQPASAASSEHFADVGTNRCDFWRVALNNFIDNPIVGIGANNFHGSYVLARRSTEEPNQTHSLPLQMLSGLGLVGALLTLAWLVALITAIARYTRSGPIRSSAVGMAIAFVVYWLVQTSLDWLWNLPAVTIPALLLAGGCTACASTRLRARRAPATAAVGLGLVVLVVAAILPQTMADWNARRAADPALAQSPAQALILARSAASWDPTWPDPMLDEARLLSTLGQEPAAANAAIAAIEREPNSWQTQYSASAILNTAGKHKAAREALAAARALNPKLPRPKAAQRVNP